MRPRRWFYVWFMPLAWGLASLAGASHPGDEYGMWAFSSLAGVWVLAVIRVSGNIWNLLPAVLIAGMATLAILGLLLDLLRTPRRLAGRLYAGAAIAFCVMALVCIPMGKAGSGPAYLFFSLNMGLQASAVSRLPVMSIWRLVTRTYAPGHCSRCDYDLTDNVSGICPECGTAIESRP